MKKIREKICAVILAAATILTCVVNPIQAEAATKSLKDLNISWDLKNDKDVTFKTKIGGMGMQEEKVRISDYKITDASKKGYKKLTFKVIYNYNTDWSQEQIHACNNTDEGFGANDYYTVVDYKTGTCLENKNKYNVTVKKIGDWQYSNRVIKVADCGCWIRMSGTQECKISVTYPKEYKNLCILVGGSTKTTDTSNNNKFWNAKTTFDKTTYYSQKDSSVCHGVRVK